MELQPGMAAKQFVLREYADAGVAALKVFMRKEGTQVCRDSVLVRKVASMYHVRSGVLSDFCDWKESMFTNHEITKPMYALVRDFKA